MSRPTDKIRARALLALFALAALGVAAVYLLMVRTETGQDLDQAAYGGDQLEPGLGADQAERLLRTISVGSLGLATIMIAAIAITRRRPRLALVPVAVVALSLLATETLKHLVLERPDLLGAGNTTNSYPSGHTTIAISLGVAALLVVPPWLRPATAIGAISYASAVGVATVAAGWHLPSDVLGAYLVTVGVAALVVAIFRAGAPAARLEGGDGREPPSRAPAAIALGVVLGLIAVFAIALAENARGIDWTTVDRGFLAFALALPLSAALLVAALIAVAWGPLNGARGRGGG